jgi:hypothetical protein
MAVKWAERLEWEASGKVMQLRMKWAACGVVAGVLLAVIFFLFSRNILSEAPAVRTLNASVVVHEIQSLNELVSVKYTVQKVVGLEEKKVPLGSEKLLSGLTARDVKLLPDRRVQIALPPPKIVHIVIDDKATKVWDRQITWWTPWVPFNPDLERQARLTARDAIEQCAIEMGILDQARRNAETGIRGLLETVGVKAVTMGGT